MSDRRLKYAFIIGAAVSLLSLAIPRAHAVPLWQLCVERSYEVNGVWQTSHAFNTLGACYQGVPVAMHGIYTHGYCHDEHDDCN